MSLKGLFRNGKDDVEEEELSVIIPTIDKYLMNLSVTDADRAVDVNSPSQVGMCLRARYFARTGLYVSDKKVIAPRTRRIFDNGDSMHDRVQGYLLRAGSLLISEPPIFNTRYNIQGHSDGLIQHNDSLYVIELKSKKAELFYKLDRPDEGHIDQASVYMYCLLSHINNMLGKYGTAAKFIASEPDRRLFYAQLHSHLTDGSKFSRAEKIEFEVDNHITVDNLLWDYAAKGKFPDKVSILYENKNDQSLKEFIIKYDPKRVESILADYAYLNDCIVNSEMPPRQSHKTNRLCTWCDYIETCWGA